MNQLSESKTESKT